MVAHKLIKTLKHLVEQKIPTYLWGSPGVGKSSIVKQIAKDKNIGFIDLRLSLMDPTDLKGIPFYDANEQTALWAPPAFLPREGEGILFLDELNTAPPSLQASAYQLILDRCVGEYKLPDGWAIVSAGNKESDRGVTYKMAPPLANRFVHLEMDVDLEDWKLWAYKNNICESVIAYLSYKTQNLFTFDPSQNQKSFATPRSWEYVDKILKSHMDESLLLDAISGAIGKDIGVDFLSFFKVMHKLPDIKSIVESSKGEYVDDVATLYALSSVLVSMVLKDNSRLDNVLKYSLNLKGEFSVKIVQDLQKNGLNMQTSPVFSLWIKKFSYLLE